MLGGQDAGVCVGGVWGEGYGGRGGGGVNTERKREFLANAHNYVRAGFKVNWQNCQRIKKCKMGETSKIVYALNEF